MIFLFDLDDTLLDDLAAKRHYMPRLYNRFKEIITYEELEFYVKWREAIPKYHAKYARGEMTFEEQRAQRVKEAFGAPDLTDKVLVEVVKAFDRYFKEGWRPFRDTISTLEYLKEFRKGVITNGSGRQQNDKIDTLGIRAHFECIMISEEQGVAKPHAGIFNKACEMLACKPSDCWFVGDSWELDIRGSRAAGMNPVWFNRYGKDLPEQLDNVIVISELNQVKAIAESARSKKSWCEPRN
jgi:putative hydrolase of the HAD superfamily